MENEFMIKKMYSTSDSLLKFSSSSLQNAGSTCICEMGILKIGNP